MMSRVKKGIVAGFVATLVISVLEAVNIFALNSMFQPFPGMVASLLGMDGNLAAGWTIHLFSGTFILGSLFGVMCPRLPTDTAETKGIVFAVGAWVVMMLGVFFIGDSQVLGSNMATLGWMLVTHIVFGIVLGTVYSRLVEREKRAHAVVGAHPAH
ncbi:DUF6789 family protein [uncultured Brevundimonas sp.]|uniref:DUF6789 family protein n=1 Tax=uncultured Brevundimonas sp. TaxID=213418 RepID=UPI0025E6F6D3|nr:DUF6789 family protein [uncultured Brevundimonas sp.]